MFLPLGLAINLPLAEAVSLHWAVIFQASFVYTMYSRIILYLQLFMITTGWQEVVDTESPQVNKSVKYSLTQ
jgi:hypothetical protein